MHAWKTLALSAIGSCLALSSPLSAQDPDIVTAASPYGHTGHHYTMYDGDGHPAKMMTHWAEKLDLTGQQQSDIQIIMSDYAVRFRDLARLGKETAGKLLQTAPDDPQYRAMTDEASAMAASSAAEVVVLLAEMRAKLYSVLTLEQRERLKELRQSRHDGDPPEPDSG